MVQNIFITVCECTLGRAVRLSKMYGGGGGDRDSSGTRLSVDGCRDEEDKTGGSSGDFKGYALGNTCSYDA